MEATLEGTKRETFGKNEARRTRASGRLPAIVYGSSSEGATGATAISVDPKALSRILHSDSGANTLISLKVDGLGDAKVLVKDYLLDPVTHQMLHADFYRVAMDRAIQVTIPIVLRGEPKGVKQQGGVLEFVRREIQIECLPGDIPEHVEIDVSELVLHQGVRLRDVATSTKWTALTELDAMLVHVITPKAEEVAEPAEGAAAAPVAAAEPEVIKRGKKDEDEEKADTKKADTKK